MTNAPQDVVSAVRDRPAGASGSPLEKAEAAGDVEVTDKMIQAGIEVFGRWRGLDFGTEEDAVVFIFTAMVLASR